MSRYVTFEDCRLVHRTPRGGCLIEFNCSWGPEDRLELWVPEVCIEEDPKDVLSVPGVGHCSIAESYCDTEGLAYDYE